LILRARRFDPAQQEWKYLKWARMSLDWVWISLKEAL
jgi:hypothetical protein